MCTVRPEKTGRSKAGRARCVSVNIYTKNSRSFYYFQMSSALSRREETAEGEERGTRMEETMEGIASIALLPCGSVSGHFIKLPESSCYGLHGTGISSGSVIHGCSPARSLRLFGSRVGP